MIHVRLHSIPPSIRGGKQTQTGTMRPAPRVVAQADPYQVGLRQLYKQLDTLIQTAANEQERDFWRALLARASA